MVFVISGTTIDFGDNAAACIQEEARLNKLDIEARCIGANNAGQKLLSKATKSTSAETAAQNFAEYQRNLADINRRRAEWATTDRGWCGMVRRGWITEDDKKYWPYQKKPKECPKWFMK